MLEEVIYFEKTGCFEEVPGFELVLILSRFEIWIKQ